MRNIITGIAIAVITVFGYNLIVGDKTVVQNVGSVVDSAVHFATSTAGSTQFGAFTGDRLVKTGFGTLGSVVITGANTGIVNFYNATTTNVNLRTNNTSTSSIHIASLPASVAAGTYVYDVSFTTGLLVDLLSGVMPTTTITYR